MSNHFLKKLLYLPSQKVFEVFDLPSRWQHSICCVSPFLHKKTKHVVSSRRSSKIDCESKKEERSRAGRVRVKTRTRVDSSHIFRKTRTRLGLEILETLTRLYDSSHSLKKIFIRFYENITIYKIKFPIIHKKLNILHRNHFSRSFFLSIHSYIVVNDSSYVLDIAS